MSNYVDDSDEEDKCIYTPKYGQINPTSNQFDDHSLLGAVYYQYKIEKIIFWTDQNKNIAGIQTWFKNAIDSNSINSGENKGSLSLDLHEFVINSNEYLVESEIWTSSEKTGGIKGIYLRTNKGSDFLVGDRKGNKMDIESIKDGNKIIISFFGSYDKYMESFGLHLMEKKEYMKVLFTGYFELKAKLKKEKYKQEILEKMKNKKFNFQEEAIIKTCLLPSAPFNVVMKFCVI